MITKGVISSRKSKDRQTMAKRKGQNDKQWPKERDRMTNNGQKDKIQNNDL